MKIALYVPSWPPGSTANGIVTYAAQIVPALRRLGHVVYVLTSDIRCKTPDEYTIDLARFQRRENFTSRIKRKLFRQNPYGFAAPAIVRAVRELVRDKGIEILEIEESFGWSYAVSHLRLIPVVVRLHGPWFLNGSFDRHKIDKRADHSRELLEKRGVRTADLVTSPSSSVLEAVRRHYDLEIKNSVVIPNSISAASENELWRFDKCLPSTLLYVGRFDKRKGGDLILRAFALLAAKDAGVRLIFVGPDLGVANADGTLEHYPEFAQRNLPDSVRTRIDFRGPLSNLEVATLRRTMFATVVASQYEILPYAVLEAMSFGCPLVATSVGGIPELVKHMENGFLVPTQDAGALALACRSLLDQPNLAARLGKQAWEDCCRQYTPDKLARDTVAAYERTRDRFEKR